MRGGSQDLLDLVEAAIEIDELGASLTDERIVEPILAKHLENEPAEVAKALVSHLEEHTSLAPQRARGWERDTRRALAAESHAP